MRCLRAIRLVPIALFLLTVPASARAAETKLADVEKILHDKDFWDKAGRRADRKWTDEEQKHLQELKSSSKDPLLRLRANKILLDLSGAGKYTRDQEPIVLGAFRSLEKNLSLLPVKILCVDQGFTHFSVGTTATGESVFLIEHVEARGFNGGLNLKWDGKNKAVVEVKPWGDVRGK
jgi:hypothetical protein